MAQKTWFPQSHQMIFDRNNKGSYPHSVFVGLTAPLLNLPTMVWRGVISPPLHGIKFIAIFSLGSIWAGFRGHLRGELIPMPNVTIEIVNVVGEKKP